MGGSIGEGNTTASAEFNIYADPEAADVVFRSGVPITMIGLDVTHQALLDREAVAALRATGTRSAGVAAELTEFALDRNLEWSGSTTTAIHDAVAVAHLMVPDLVAVARYHVAVDTTNGPARGRTVCDGLPYRLRRDGRVPNADVGIVIDRGALHAAADRRLLAAALKRVAGPHSRARAGIAGVVVAQPAGVSQTRYSVTFSGVPSFAERSNTRSVPYWALPIV